MIKNFSCFKVSEKNEGQPDYRLTAKIGEAYVDIGAGWIKEGAKGKYISFSLGKPYNDKPGYQITTEASVAEGMEKLHEVAAAENINIDDIPF